MALKIPFFSHFYFRMFGIWIAQTYCRPTTLKVEKTFSTSCAQTQN